MINPFPVGSDSSGKATLPGLVKSFRDEYKELSESRKSAIVEEFSKVREAKSIGLRVSAQSKVNDVTKTLRAVENEVSISEDVLI
jgi:uncharacterized protein YpuA (DUF1002 family)